MPIIATAIPVHWRAVRRSSPKRKDRMAVSRGQTARKTLVCATPRCLIAYAQMVNAVAEHSSARARVG